MLGCSDSAPSTSAPTALKVTWTVKLPALFDEQVVTIRVFYNRAVAGVQDLTQNRNVSFLSSSTPGDTNTINL